MHRTAMDLMIRFARPALLTLAFHSLASAADFGLATDPPAPSEIKSRDPFGFEFNPLASPETKAAGASGLVAKPPILIPPPIPQGPIINAIEIQYAGPAKFARERILGHMTTAVGEHYSEQVIERDMRDIYNSGGIYNVRIFGQPCADGVKIIVVVQCRPKISEICIQGVTAKIEAALRNEMRTQTGKLFDGAAVAADKQRIIDYYARTGMGPIDVEESVDIDDKLGIAKVVLSIHEAPEESLNSQAESANRRKDSRSLDHQWDWLLEFFTPAFYGELTEKSKQALLGRITTLESALADFPDNEDKRQQLGGAYMQLGRGFERIGKTNEAIEAFRIAVTLIPKEADAWEELAGCRIKSGNLDEAFYASDRVIRADPLSFDGWIIRGALLTRSRRFDEARKALEKAGSLEPSSRLLPYPLAMLNLAEGRLDDFRKAALESLEMSSEALEDVSNPVAVFHAFEGFPRKLEILRSALKTNDEDLSARAEILMRLSDAGLWDEAADEAKKYVDRDSFDRGAWAVLAQADLKRDHWKEGVTEMRRARSLGFDTPESVMELATGLIALSEFEEARETLTSFLSASPKNPEALALLGVISRKEKRIEESDEYSRQALELAPHNTSALMNLAINSMEKKQPSAVIEFAQRVLADDCKAWRAWELIGRAREQLGDTDAAEEAFKQVADIQPQQSDGWQGIARNVRSYERAAAAARKAAQVDCENAVAQALPGMTEARFGRNADAIQSLISVLSQHPENDIALNAFNDLWVPLEKTDAIEVLRQVTAECPEWPLGWRLLAHDYAALQRLPEALDALKRAAGQHEGEKLPGFAGILSDLVIASATSGDLEGAAKTCERLEQLDAPLAKSMRERYLQQTQSPR